VTAPAPGERRCWAPRPIIASDACDGRKRPTEGTYPNTRVSTTSPQASRVTTAPT
jgi:hypothetical protein